MNAYDYLRHVKSCIDDVASRSKYTPVFGTYITKEHGFTRYHQAIMHPKDNLKTRFKTREEMRYYYRDL